MATLYPENHAARLLAQVRMVSVRAGSSVVYREVFETILFFAALWSQGHTDAILGGAAAAIVLLALIARAMLRYSRRLPIGTFFAYSSVLIGILAVVLAGKGISGLQEAGLLGITPLPNLPRIPIWASHRHLSQRRRKSSRSRSSRWVIGATE